MEIKDENFKYYIKYPVNQIPTVDLISIINELSINAIFFMGCELKPDELKSAIKAVIYVLNNYYGYMPLYLVAEAFSKGSIGDMGGTARFNARNVNIWMAEIRTKFQNLTAQQKSKDDSDRRQAEEIVYKNNQVHNVLFGTALSLKLVWVYKHQINADDWERYTLDKIVEKLKNGFTDKTLRPADIWTKNI